MRTAYLAVVTVAMAARVAAAAPGELVAAAKAGDEAKVQALLARKVPVDGRDARGYTALEVAVISKRGAIVRMLLDAGADPNAISGRGRPPLVGANLEVATLLLAHGADVDGRDRSGVTAVMTAAGDGDLAVVELLIAHKVNLARRDQFGADVSARATSAKDLRVLARVLEAGAPVDGVDNEGETPLTRAVGYRRLDQVELLVARGASAKRPGLLARAIAAKVALPIVAGGADLGEVDDLGRTALHLAAFADQPDVVTALLARGADRDRADRLGRSPLLLAWLFDSDGAARALEQAGARLAARDVAALAVPGGGLEVASLPPVAAKPRDKTSLAEAEQAARAADGRDLDARVVLYRRAIAAEPASLQLRTSLALALAQAEEPALAMQVALQVLDGGSFDCIAEVRRMGHMLYGSIPDELQARYEATLVEPHGKPTAATAPAEALWQALQAGAKLDALVADRVHVSVHTQNARTDEWTTPFDKTVDRAGLARWQAGFATTDKHRSNVWWCDATCCSYRPEDPRGPPKHWLDEVCVDGAGKVRSFSWSGYR